MAMAMNAPLHEMESPLRHQDDAVLCPWYGAYLEMAMLGCGLAGGGILLPREDIRGTRLGVAARRLLLQAPAAEIPPMDWAAYDNWLRLPSSGPHRKVVGRLYWQGLIWSVYRYQRPFSNAHENCIALTPLGVQVLDVFGDAIRAGQRIRWERWPHPSVAYHPDRLNQTLDWLASDLGFESDPDSTKDHTYRKLLQAPHGPDYEPWGRYGNDSLYTLIRLHWNARVWGDGFQVPRVWNPSRQAWDEC